MILGGAIIEIPKVDPLREEDVVEAIANAYGRRILAACIRHAKAVKDLSQETGLPLPTTYRHVHSLVEKGLIVIERSAMTPEGKKCDLYRSRVRSARIEMDNAGERVVWEANEAVEDRLASLWESLRFQVGKK